MMLHRHTLPASALLLGLTAFCSLPAGATTFTVLNLNDSGADSLRQILDTASANPDADVVNFAPAVVGTIALTSGEIKIEGAVTINGPGATKLTVSGSNASRIFKIDSGAVVNISGLKLADGTASGSGGAIDNDGGHLTLRNCVLSANLASSDGGALNNEGGDVALINSTVLNNSAINCGGLRNRYGIMTLASSTVADNTASGEAGGICSVRNTGGAVLKGTLILTNSTVARNIANRYGGGIHNTNGILNIINSTLSGNSTGYPGGGGVYSIGSLATVKITNSTLSGNASTYNGYGGGGIYMEGGTMRLGNTLVAGNTVVTTSGNGKEIYRYSGTFISEGNNLFGVNGVAGLYQVTPVASDITPLPGVTLNQIIGALANNGGPTQTHTLVTNSPAINKGSNALIPTGVTTDQRGAGFPRIVNSIVDIGAVEVGSVPRYSLNVSKTGGLGLVTSNPAGINCGATCAANFTSGTLVKLTAKPDTGYIFTGWSGNCNGTALTCDLTMNAAKAVTAGFAKTPVSYPLTLVKAGTGFGTVASSPAGINCGAACGFQVANFTTNSTVVLTATALAGSGNTFTGWSGCDSVNVALRQCTVKMSAARFVTANFARPLLIVGKTGNGLVVSNPVGIFCGSTCVAPYSPSTVVTLVAIPATGYGFGSWVGCTPKPGFPQQCTLTMGAINKSVTANFIK